MPMAVKKQSEQEQQRLLQEKYMEYQMLEQMIVQLQSQMEAVDKQMVELLTIKQGLDDLKDAKKGSEMLVPLANGIFVKGELTDPDNLIINVGSNVAVNRTIQQTKELLEKQFEAMKEMQASLMAQLQKYGTKAQSVQQELAELVKE